MNERPRSQQGGVLGPLQVWVHPSKEAVAQRRATAMHSEFTACSASEWSGRGLAATVAS
jgi:hypothetical protein